MSNITKGVLLMILASLFLAFMNFFFKLIGDNMSSYEKLFFRGTLLLIVSLGTVYLERKRHPNTYTNYLGHKRNMPLLLMRSFCGGLSMLCNIYALNHLTLADSDMIFKLNSVFLVILCWMFLKEKISWHQIVALILSIIALLLIIKPRFDDPNIIHYLMAVAGMLLAAFAYVAIRKLTTSDHPEHPGTIMANLSVLILVTMAYPAAKNFSGFAGNEINYLWVSIAALFGAAGQLCFTFSFKFAPAKETGIYNYSSLLFNSYLGWLVFDQIPDKWSVLGYVLIVGTAIWQFVLNLKANRRIKYSEIKS